jgi:branched-subunit amino acid transport protein AzlD
MISEPSTSDLLGVIAISAGITWALRAVPFTLLAPLRGSALLPYLNRHMPAGMMAILVMYTLVSATSTVTGARPIAAMLRATSVTAALHLWRRNFVLSILAGTGLHVVLASTALGA